MEFWQFDEQKPVLTQDGEPVLDEQGQEKVEYVPLARPKLYVVNLFNAEQIDGIEALSRQDREVLPTVDLQASAEKLGSDPLCQELVRYLLAADVDFSPVLSDPNGFFRAARDAHELMKHAMGTPKQRQKIEASIAGRITREEKREQEVANRQYIQVPYVDKNQARALGARFDGKAKDLVHS